MKRNWFYLRRAFQELRLIFQTVLTAAAPILLLAVLLFSGRSQILEEGAALFKTCGVRAAKKIMEGFFPAEGGGKEAFWLAGGLGLITEKQRTEEIYFFPVDPAFEKFLEEETQAGTMEVEDPDFTQETVAKKPAGSYVIREKLADYDYLMKHFYNVHPTTTVGRDLMDAEKFLSMDLSLPKAAGEETKAPPQILIYHTHSQEEFADYPENPGATIVTVGRHLAKLLEAKGYSVIHDDSVYDFRSGKLDRNQAYTYALDGITGILQEYPSIEVVLDVHRDGVAADTRLVTEIEGKPMAKIMFFNGTSQSPDGPIEYLPNPNRDANMAFSFQMQLLADQQFPGLTRKIYLKGLRYNLHVRARSALIEVGAQTNTCEEAKNAMGPLAEILDQVLRGEG